MMEDLIKIFPGRYIHAIQTEAVSLANFLMRHGFKIYRINGAFIVDDETFFQEIARVLNFPSYFGHNWDAYFECLGDFYFDNFENTKAAPKKALIWEDADQTFSANAITFLQALEQLRLYVVNPESNNEQDYLYPVKQLEIFLLGKSQGFPALNL